MTWVHPLSVAVDETADTLGGKGYGLVVLRRLGLPVPPGFVIGTEACRAFLHGGRLPEGLDGELTAAIRELEDVTRRRLGDPERPLAVSVRSGGSVSMPGMMNTVLNLGLTTEATAGLAAETGDPRFALDSRERFLASFAAAVVGVVPDDAMRQLELAVKAVFSSWNTPRATTYRTVHGIPHDLGTAVVVQAMVFGNRDDHSGTGVAFSRDPNTGERVPFGEVLFGHQGEDVVAGTSTTRPLSELADRESAVWAGLGQALDRIEEHYRDACQVEFTFETGRLWLLQVRPAGMVATTADKAVRMAAAGPVILVRPQTSPLDMHGLAAAAGVVTALGGPTSHAAVVARAMGKPAVVAAADLTVDTTGGLVRTGGHTLPEGTIITVDGTSGEIVLGNADVVTATADPHLHRLLGWADQVSGDNSDRDDTQRLLAAHAVLSRT
jgi:pyruvate,orthophosphate dikinase